MQEDRKKQASDMLVESILHENRLARRWKNIRFMLWFSLFVYISYAVLSKSDHRNSTTSFSDKNYAALVKVNGMIAPDRDTSAEALLPQLKSAFSDKNAKGVIIDINSPGGTPVQAAIIHDAILAYKNKYHKKVIVVGEDLLTSGAYYIAVSADKIYVNENTLTGSIGVIMKGFGFVDLMKKIGIERRVYTAGADKDRLDPFLTQSPDDLKKIKSVMDEVHIHFKDAVLLGRKDKLHGDQEKLFSGDFWSGEQAKELGLVDDIGNLLDVSEKEFGTTKLKNYSNSMNFVKYLTGQLNTAFDEMIYT